MSLSDSNGWKNRFHVPSPCCGRRQSGASATAADAVVDAVILLAHEEVELRLT